MSNAVNRRKSAIKLISFILIAVAVLAAIFRVFAVWRKVP